MSVVIFFGAHADDIELGAGGTCAKLSAAGMEVHVVIGTDEGDAQVAASRREEAITAAGLLGVPAQRVHFLGFSDGTVRCERASVGHVRKFLAERNLRPSVVFTHTDTDSHQDHVELTRIVRGAVRQCAVLKYVVRNSAIVSHFRPDVYSAVDAYIPVKSAALCAHRSQMAVGRVSPAVLINFSKRFSFHMQGRHFEAFELEVQEGAENFHVVLDCANDSPFSRLWQPLCAHAGVTVLAASGDVGGTRRVTRPVVSRAPDDLQLVTRLQAEIMMIMQGQGQARATAAVRVERADEQMLESDWPGVSIVLGGPARNPLARALLDKVQPASFLFDVVGDQYGGRALCDVRTNTVYEPTYWPMRGGPVEVGRDYGLLTMVHELNPDQTAGPTLTIGVMGIHAPGTAAAMSCLTKFEHIDRICSEARQVIKGNAHSAQWLIPCDGAGEPDLANIRSVVRRSMLPAGERRRPMPGAMAAGVPMLASA